MTASNTEAATPMDKLHEARLTTIQAVGVALVTAAGGALTAWIGKGAVEQQQRTELQSRVETQSVALKNSETLLEARTRELSTLSSKLLDTQSELLKSQHAAGVLSDQASALRQSIQQQAQQSRETLSIEGQQARELQRRVDDLTRRLEAATKSLRNPPEMYVGKFSWDLSDDQCRTVAAQAVTKSGGGDIKMREVSVAGIKDAIHVRIICSKPGYFVVASASEGMSAGSFGRQVYEELLEIKARIK
jgi:hypothetical protein